MSVMVTLEIPVHKERLEDFLDVLREALKETRVYEGCQKVETFVEMDTGSVVLVEKLTFLAKPNRRDCLVRIGKRFCYRIDLSRNDEK